MTVRSFPFQPAFSSKRPVNFPMVVLASMEAVRMNRRSLDKSRIADEECRLDRG
jgi:hypothetical protein